MSTAEPKWRDEGETVELRACGSTYLLMCALPALLVLLYLYLAVRTSAGTTGLLVTLALLGLAMYLARSFRVRLSPSGIEYRGPFFTRGAVAWSAVDRVTTGAHLIPGLRTPPYYMAFLSRDRSRPLVINIKPFGRDDLVSLVRYIT